MTYAYDRICLDRAADTLGRMLDYSVYSLHYDVAAIIDLFISSGTAALFERGDIRIIAGMSGIELAYEVLEKSGIAYERMQPRYTKSFSPEYWCGHTLAHIQWETCLPFEHIVESFSVQGFISVYGSSRLSYLDALPLDINDADRSAELKDFGRRFSDEAVSKFISATGNKSIPGKADDTQSGLAKASGVPLRTIQQYEQRQKDLAKARAEYLIALARAMDCDPSRLI